MKRKGNHYATSTELRRHFDATVSPPDDRLLSELQLHVLSPSNKITFLQHIKNDKNCFTQNRTTQTVVIELYHCKLIYNVVENVTCEISLLIFL